MSIEIVIADYGSEIHSRDIVSILDNYARDPMGGGEALSEFSKMNLVAGLSAFPGAVTVLAYEGRKVVGIVNAIPGFSTFSAKSLLNIHDLAVLASHRGLGISQKLLAAVEEIAERNNCCKITLEVLQGNAIAQKAYRKFGFTGYELDPEAGCAEFWQKKIG